MVIRFLLFLPVLKELEGLARGGKDRDYMPVPSVDPEHAAKVAEAAKMALVFLRSRSPGVRCVTTRGTVIHTSAFAMEEDTEQVRLHPESVLLRVMLTADLAPHPQCYLQDERNDDKILTTSLSLCRSSGKDECKPGNFDYLLTFKHRTFRRWFPELSGVHLNARCCSVSSS
jgi:protein SMG6